MNDKNDSNKNQKLLNHKRKSKFTLEEIINIYCRQHNIEDNEIPEKIKTIYYRNPEQNILIDYNKDNGDEFPLSKHIYNKKEKVINLEEDKKEEKDNEKLNENEVNKDKDSKEKKGEDLLQCFICGWDFLKEMSFEEKSRHINLCLEGKGEENKKEIISTYKEIQNLRNGEEEQENNNEIPEINDQENNEENDNNNNQNEE